MNLQRREEISVLLAEPVTGEAGQALEYRDALMECRTHIDTLEQSAAERVIARGAARALAQPNDATLASLAACGSTKGAVRATLSWARQMLARTDGPTPDYTGEGSAWVPPVESHSIGTADSIYFRRELESLTQRLPSADGSWLARYLLKLARVADSATVDCAPVEARAVVAPEPTSDEWRAIAENARSSDMMDFLAGAAAYSLWLRRRARTIPADRVPGDGMVEELRLLRELEKRTRAIKDNPTIREKIILDKLDALRANQGGGRA